MCHVSAPSEPIAVHMLGTQAHLCGRTVLSNEVPDFALIKLVKPVSDHQTLQAIKNIFRYPYTNFQDASKYDHQSITSGSSSKRTNIIEGEPIFAVGFGLQEPKSSSTSREPLVTRGVVSKVVRWQGREEVMLVTTAVVHPGMSGGMVVSASTGKPLGMVVSNSE